MSARFPRTSVPIVGVIAASLCLATTAAVEGKGPIRQLRLDPEAPVVGLFDALEEQKLGARVVPKTEYEARVLLTNQTDQPLTVAAPQAVAAAQFFEQEKDEFGDFSSLLEDTTGDSQDNRAQDIGGQLLPSGPGSQNPFNFPNTQGPGFQGPAVPGTNFFSIPSKKTVQLRLESVCLEHGKSTPHRGMKYALLPLDRYTDDPVLVQLLENYDLRQTNRLALQAAAWHLADGMSWKELARKRKPRLGIIGKRYFTRKQLREAFQLVRDARKQVEKSRKQARGTREKL